MAKICIITPSQLGSNPRVVKAADALHNHGFEVTVLATRRVRLVEPRDQALLEKRNWNAKRVNLSNAWRWRASRAAQIVFSNGCSILGYKRLAKFAISPMALPLSIAARFHRADLYIAHYPAALPVAAAMAHRHRVPYAFDAEDFHLGESPDGKAYDHKRRMLRSVEARYLPRAAFVTAASPGIANAYASTYGIEVPEVILNVFPLSQAPAKPTTQGSATPGPSVYWFSQTVGTNRGIECAVKAIARSRSRPHLYLRGTPAHGFVDILDDLASREGVSGHIHLLAPDDPQRMERHAAHYDVGLAGETGHTRNNRLALGNKIFTYLMAGIPVLLSGTPAQKILYKEIHTAALPYENDRPETLAAALDSLLLNPSRLAQTRAAAFHLGQTRFNWEREQSALISHVKSALGLA